MLPFSDLEEAERILKNFVRDLQENGLLNIEMAVKTDNPSIGCFEFSIHAGLARGKPNIELDSIMKVAESKQKPIAQFTCDIPS